MTPETATALSSFPTSSPLPRWTLPSRPWTRPSTASPSSTGWPTPGEEGVSDGFTTNHDQKTGRVQFPVGADALDRLIENETYLDIFTQCLGDEPAYCNAHLFLRSGPQPRFVTTSRRAGNAERI